ncbi:MAG TPA: hypothetical protein VEF34_09195 [Syntrophobacteraceae bacterium]|nr:hypothetical protein [Syntrophobacteraceae bacterium]
MNTNGRIALLVVTGIMLLWGVTHASLSKYRQKEQAIWDACNAAKSKLTPQEQKNLQCGTPEISLVSPVVIKPGETAEVVIKGKFPAGTNFVFESDRIEVLKETSNANSYRATIQAASGGGPETLSIEARVPLCCNGARLSGAISVTGNFEWELKAANGWTVMAHSIATSPGGKPSTELPYLLEFFRGTEKAPFAKRNATLNPSNSEPPSYYFSISSQDASSMDSQQELQALMKRIMDPKLSQAEREKLNKRIKELSDQMAAEMKKMTDPEYFKKLQIQEQEFGCTAINLQLQEGAPKGNMSCGEKVGRNIALTGTIKLVTK